MTGGGTRRLGVDLDNTLACYGAAFHAVATEMGLATPDAPSDKTGLRDHLRAAHGNTAWTRVQGRVYGPRMTLATPCPGALDALARLRAAGWRLMVVSHRTALSQDGAGHDLHGAARAWLRVSGVMDAAALDAGAVFLETTRGAKAARIAALLPDAFVDDLPELFAEPGFPAGVRRVLYDPHGRHPDAPADARVHTWTQAAALLDAGS